MLARYYKRKIKERIFGLIEPTDQWKQFRKNPNINSATMLRFKRTLYPSLQTVLKNPEKLSFFEITLGVTLLKTVHGAELLDMVNPEYDLDYDVFVEETKESEWFDRITDKWSAISLAAILVMSFEVALENIALYKFP